jgi:hypothetical protein
VSRELSSVVDSFEVGEPELLPSAFVHGVEAVDCTFVTSP